MVKLVKRGVGVLVFLAAMAPKAAAVTATPVVEELVLSSEQPPQKQLVDDGIAGQAEAEINLRRMKSGFATSEESESFLQKVEQMRIRLGGSYE